MQIEMGGKVIPFMLLIFPLSYFSASAASIISRLVWNNFDDVLYEWLWEDERRVFFRLTRKVNDTNDKGSKKDQFLHLVSFFRLAICQV